MTNTIRRMPFPNAYKASLIYQETLIYNPGAGTLATNSFRCNSLFDPLQSTGGHQPRGYDSLTGLYQTYCVIGARVKVTFTPIGGGNGFDGVVYGIALRNPDDTPESNYNNYIEQGNCSYQVAELNSPMKPIYSKYSPRSFNRVSKVLSEPFYTALTNANPPDSVGAKWDIFIGAADQSADLPSYSAIIVIEYVAIFREPVDLVQS